MPVDWPRTRLALILTMGCNFQCGHCVTESTPERLSEKLSTEETIEYLKLFAHRGGRVVNFVGGEPTLNLSALLEGIHFCRNNGMTSILTTNAWWGRPDKVNVYIEMFANSGLTQLICSYDQWHAKFQSWDDTVRAMRAAEANGIRANLSWVSRNDAEKLKEEMTSLIGSVGFRVASEMMRLGLGRVYGIGRAKSLVGEWDRSADMWLCHEIKNPSPFIGILPGKKMLFRCDGVSPDMTHDIEGDFTESADSLEDSDFYRTLRHDGLLPLMRQFKATEYVDHCHYCQSVMKSWRDTVKKSELYRKLQSVQRPVLPVRAKPPKKAKGKKR